MQQYALSEVRRRRAELFGDPEGGNVSFVVEGVTIEVITTDAQTLAEVMAALALAIESDETLAALGVTAAGVGSQLFVGGSYVGVVIDDPGMSDCSTGPAPPSIAGALANTCPETTVQLSTGAYDRYQWYFGGRLIPGATSSTYDATLTGNYSVRVQDRFGCSADSLQETVLVGFCAETEISPPGAIYPARIEVSGDSPTGYFLYFQEVDGVEGFNRYEGTAGSWYSHGGSPSNLCGLLECVGTEMLNCYQDLGTGEVRVALTPTPGNRYYPVSAYAGSVEGPSGRDSSGNAIDPDQSTCLP